ncbi:glycosyltransferase family 2 protein, partial [Shewanella insulae]|uniref:glycosyltransferase family 2 protein n=1 Tax=Shewanella insulae TaxID=2681496 RepID=UPI001EFE55E0
MINISVVLFKNKPSDVTEFLQRVSEYSNVNQVIVVDNSPTDQLRVSTSSFDKVVYVFSPSNPGYGASHNIGIKFSISNDVEFHLVCNLDTTFNEQCLEVLQASCFERNVGLVVPLIRYSNGMIQLSNKLIPTPFDLLVRFLAPKSWFVKRRTKFQLEFTGYKDKFEVPYVSGCFMFFKTLVFKEVGLFDERFFMYPEDIDISRRVFSSSFKVLFNPEVEIVHEYEGATYKSKKMAFVHAYNIIKYFNKWGWFW